jgi:hypothetical protein
MKKYKLTNQDMRTHNGFQWELGKEVNTDGDSEKLCNEHWLHYYHHPLLAVLLNPIHAHIINPRLFEVKALGKHLDDKGIKGGCTKMTLVKEIELPEITLNQKIAFAILCALEVYKESTYILWANNWLNNVDRSAIAAYDAAYAAYAVDAADAVDAAYAVDAAAAYAAVYAVDAADAAYAVDAYAAVYAADAADDINLIKLAKKALKYK